MSFARTSEQSLREQAHDEAFPTITRCAFCRRPPHVGTFASGRAWAKRHRERFHPEAVQTTKRGRKRRSS
jgi:hypothetical protein